MSNNSLIISTNWGNKKEVLITKHPIIENLFHKYFDKLQFKKKLPQFRLRVNSIRFFKDYELFYKSQEEQPFGLDNYYGDILYRILDDIADTKQNFFLKHVEIHKRYYNYPDNPKAHLGVYYIIIFDECMYSFIKQSEYWTKEYKKTVSMIVIRKHSYSASESRLFDWVDYVFSETKENIKRKEQYLDNLYNKICKPIVDNQ